MTEMRDCGSDAAAYVLGALDPDEIGIFRRHLATCSVCQEEVHSMQELADALPETAEAIRVPRRLRRQVLAEVRADARRRGPARTSSFSLVSPRPGMSIAFGGAAALAAAVVIGTQLGGSGHSTHVYGAEVGQASMRVTDGHGELVVRHLARPSGNRIYEVWLERPGGQPQPTPALFSVTDSGRGNVDIPGHLASGDKVLVTQEPAGGSKSPTTLPVVVASIS